MNVPISLDQFKTLSVNSVYHGTKSVSFLGPKLWEILRGSFKKIVEIDTFKKAIKTWKSGNCLCRLCRVHVQYIWFSLTSLEL